MLVTSYDYHSIMHYDSQAFGRFDTKLGTILETMVPKKVIFRISSGRPSATALEGERRESGA